jgi:four helix bundle protein
MKRNIRSEKAHSFALRIIKPYKFLAENHHEYVLSKQVLRSGTSIGANIAEACQAQSKADFVHKLSIAQKESAETRYWIILLRDSEYLKARLANSIIEDCEELQKILTASIKTVKSNLRRGENGEVKSSSLTIHH